MKFPKLNQRGIAHILAPILFIAIFAGIGGYILMASHAAPVSTNSTSVATNYTNGKIYSGGYTINEDSSGLQTLSLPKNGFIARSSSMSFGGKKVAYFTKLTWDKAFFEGKVYKGTISPNGSITNNIAIASLPTQSHALMPPVWSQDGTKVAVALSTSSGAKFWFAKTDGSYRHIIPNTSQYPMQYVSWLPGLTKIMYATYPDPVAGGPTQLCTIGIGGANNACNPIDVGSTKAQVDGIGGLAVSPDGSKVALMARIGATGVDAPFYEIYTVNPDGTALKRLTTFSDSSSGPEVQAIAWSPDGTKIAYLMQAPGRGPGEAGTGLYTLNTADGSGQTQISTQVYVPYSLSWAHQ